ncbi:ABC transporter permease [Myroides sp. WP-1]|uniref:ABC transporter permease n=1 Tax=Myroides sp. WP-1 TaxID=2759944 RepID=UPI0015FB9A07|nr:FtsX-like permease family protein [Myroides sp. WP-1]MBB1138835.1 ABC transporter permease [Myroides sp. WP-1]
MLNNWLKIWIYHSKKNKTYFLLNMLCLSIGITAVLFSTLYWHEERSFDQWNENKEHIYFLESQGEEFSSGFQPYVLSRLLKDKNSFVEDYLLYSGYFPAEVGYKKKEFTFEKALQTNASFFSFFPYKLVYGVSSSIFKNPREIAIEKEKSMLLFGQGVNPVGEQLVVDDEIYTVIAVYDLEDKRSSFMPDAVVNDHQFIVEELLDTWNYSASSVLIKTKQGDALSQAAEAIYTDYYLKPLAKSEGFAWGDFEEKTNGIHNRKMVIHPLLDLHFTNSSAVVLPETGVKKNLLYSIVGLSWMLFVLSLFNYVNLSLSQSLSRAKEVGIRKVLGGYKRTIMKQALFENTVVVLFAMLLSITVVLWFVPIVNVFLATDIEVRVTEVLVVLLGIYVLLSIFGGLIPALYRANYKVLNVLKGDFHRSRAGSLLKNGFLVIQFAIACWFISGTYVIYQQVKFMTTKDLGFKGDQIIAFPFMEGVDPALRNTTYLTFKQEALKIKGVEQVGMTDLDYSEQEKSRHLMLFPFEGKNVKAEVFHVEEGYLEMMQVKLKEGRYLSKQFSNDMQQNVLINESLLRQLNRETIDELTLANQTVVGLVQDFHTTGLTHSISPKMFALPKERNFFFEDVSMKVKVEQLEALIPEVEKLWLSLNKGTTKPFTYTFIDQKFAQSFEQTKSHQKIMLYLSYIVLFIALFGLFAVSSFTIGTRLKEIAIRKVLGAETSHLILKISYQYFVFCVIGFGLSIFPSYYLLQQWLKDYAYRIEIGYEVYVVCFVLMGLLTLAIVVSRAYKATKVNVLEYIKYE